MSVNRYMLMIMLICMLLFPLAVMGESLSLYAAGSLKAALAEVVQSYEETYGGKVTTTFGPSGILLKGIESGEKPDLFASANMKHPEKLAAAGWGRPVVLFARNTLCAIAQPELKVTTTNLLEVLLDEKVRVGTSTPKADPSGDYAWELFGKAEALKPGSQVVLTGKALQLTGGPESQPAPEGRNQYGWVMEEKKADLFLTYCTNGVLARKEVSSLQMVAIPEELSVGADYGLLVRNDAPVEAWRLAMYILSPAGQKILQNYGFQAVGVPK